MKKRNSLMEMCALGAFLRFWLASSEYQKTIADRIEISTPVNSWERVVEGLYLQNLNINPYEGDILHETPLYMELYRTLITRFSSHVYAIFIVGDVITALLLYLFAKQCTLYLENMQKEDQDRYGQHTEGDRIFYNSFISPEYIAAAYLFNPYVIFNCVGCTTTVFDNLYTTLLFTGLIYENLCVTTFSLGLCILKNVYFVSLISPMVIHFSKQGQLVNKPVIAVVMVATFWILLTYWSYYINNSWYFLNHTYGFVLTVPDVRPNIGLFWYFFTEMFEHFKTFFLCSFQINAMLLYLIPLAIRLRKDPMLLAATFITLIAIFKSYPCLGDVGFVLAILFCWKHLFRYTQQCFPIVCGFCVTTALAPTVWYLWIYAGSANANFYFGVTLAFGTTLIFLITDLLFAYVKREFELVYGSERKINGRLANLVLK